MSDKMYHPEKGVPIDGDFLIHLSNCAQCRRYDATKPGTLSLLCLEGSVLWKRENVVSVPKTTRRSDDSYASPKDLKAAMKYK